MVSAPRRGHFTWVRYGYFSASHFTQVVFALPVAGTMPSRTFALAFPGRGYGTCCHPDSGCIGSPRVKVSTPRVSASSYAMSLLSGLHQLPS
jgi:hypothetical protein